MRKLLLFLLLLPTIVFAQGTATQIRSGSSLPTACGVAYGGTIFYKTTSPIGHYECSVAGNPGTWRQVYGASTGASGSDGCVQLSSSGAFSCDSALTFNTSSKTLNIGTTGQGLVKLIDSGGTNYVGLKAPSSATSYTWLFPAADTSGFVKSDGAGNLSIATPTVTSVNGVAYPSSPSTHSVPVITASNTATNKVIPDCTDTGGNHLNFTQSTDAFSCGTSGSGGGGGGLVLLEEHTASASATLDLATRNVTGQSGASFQSDYDNYVITLVNLIPATNSVTAQLRVSTNGGSTYDSGSNYSFGYQYFGFGTGDTGVNNGNSQTQISICGTNIAATSQSATAAGVNGHIYLFNPLSSVVTKFLTWDVGVRLQTNNYHMYGAASYESATAVNALRFLFSSGNVASGTIRLYGVAK